MNWNRSKIDGDVDDRCFFSPLYKGLCNHVPVGKELVLGISEGISTRTVGATY